MPSRPYLLYVYPWMPYPRRTIIYIREKHIPSSLIQIVRVSDPQSGNLAEPGYPPRPLGSLPVLAIPSQDAEREVTYTHIRSSLSIMHYVDELCDTGEAGFPKSAYSMRGTDRLSRAREIELISLADECTGGWNPVRLFGTGAGTMSLPAASKESLRWVHRSLATIERWFQDENRDFATLRKGGERGPSMGEIVLYQFLEFTKDCYGKDMTEGSGEIVKDVYGRAVMQKYPKLREFFEAFGSRDSVVRDVKKGEVASEQVLKAMQTWTEGST